MLKNLKNYPGNDHPIDSKEYWQKVAEDRYKEMCRLSSINGLYIRGILKKNLDVDEILELGKLESPTK
jgi:hypothetical protein